LTDEKQGNRQSNETSKSRKITKTNREKGRENQPNVKKLAKQFDGREAGQTSKG
jgi:hypothetical protein